MNIISIKRISLIAIIAALGIVSGSAVSARTRSEIYFVSMQASDDHWMRLAQDGVVYADVDHPNDSVFAKFWIEDLNGGDLEDGDTIVLMWICGCPAVYRATVDPNLGGGDPLESHQSLSSEGSYQQFVIETVDCDNCSVSEGGRISLTSAETGLFMYAQGGGDDEVKVLSTSRGSWEIFELVVW